MSELNTPTNLNELNRVGSEIEILKKGIADLKSTREDIVKKIDMSEKMLESLTAKHVSIFKSIYNFPVTEVQKQLPLITMTKNMKPHRTDLREHYKRLIFNERVTIRPICEEIGISECTFRGFIKNTLRSTRQTVKKIEDHYKNYLTVRKD